MFDVGGGELILILIAALLLFGPKKIPEIAQMIGKGMQQIKKAQSQFQAQISDIKNEVNKQTDFIVKEPVQKPIPKDSKPDE